MALLMFPKENYNRGIKVHVYEDGRKYQETTQNEDASSPTADTQ